MPVTIRSTREDDAPSLPALEHSAGQLFHSVPDLAWVADDANRSVEDHLVSIRAGTSWVVVDDDDKPVGFLIAEFQDGELHIEEIAIHRDRQRQGLGRALIETAIAWTRARRHVAVTLTTFRNVPWNEPYYRRLGFETLLPDHLNERLASIMQEEAARGLPAGKRCAMRLAL